MEEYKFKAREIVIKMQFQKKPLNFEQAKECSLVLIAEIIEELKEFDTMDGYSVARINFWNDVKQEIVNL